MKKMIFVLAVMLMSGAVGAAERGAAQRVAISPRTTVTTAFITQQSSLKWDKPNLGTNGVVAAESDDEINRDAERLACVSNNIGVGNTFVWASKYSNTSNYSTMVEDTENPENNVCWVRVELRSNDAKIDLSDVPGKYFQMGTNIECGAWADADLIEKRILDAKKSARTWATVAGSVGGAGIGVGAMELFGNKLIGGAVQGQKGLSEDELFILQLKELKTSDKNRYDEIVATLNALKNACDSASGSADCAKIHYNDILTGIGEKNK